MCATRLRLSVRQEITTGRAAGRTSGLEEGTEMSETTKRVWIAQCLCPQKHCIFAASGEAEDKNGANVNVLGPLRAQIGSLLGAGTINPWCGLCHAVVEMWTYEVGRTRFRSMAEAKPELERAQSEQIATGATYGELLGVPTRH